MTTARSIIVGALTFGLNRLSPGETLNADDGAVCLDALNHIADELNGSKSFLFREVLTTSSPITGASAALGVAWPTLAPGDEIAGATLGDEADHMDALTMAQYAAITDKVSAGSPRYYAHDGLATVYLYPAASGQTVTLRTKAVVGDFADLDTEYSMPKGYKSALSALLAEKMAPTMVGGVSAPVAQAAQKARNQLSQQSVNPAIIGGASGGDNILSGWN